MGLSISPVYSPRLHINNFLIHPEVTISKYPYSLMVAPRAFLRANIESSTWSHTYNLSTSSTAVIAHAPFLSCFGRNATNLRFNPYTLTQHRSRMSVPTCVVHSSFRLYFDMTSLVTQYELSKFQANSRVLGAFLSILCWLKEIINGQSCCRSSNSATTPRRSRHISFISIDWQYQSMPTKFLPLTSYISAPQNYLGLIRRPSYCIQNSPYSMYISLDPEST